MKLLANTSSAGKQDSNQDITESLALAKSKSSNKLLICILLMATSVVSFWQMYSVSKMYLATSTDFVAEVKFDVNSKTLPAMTFCTNIGHMDANRSDEVFDNWKVEDIVAYISVVSDEAWSREYVTEHYVPHAIQSISYKYYCFTINSKQRGTWQMELKGDQHLIIKLKQFGIYSSWWIFMHNSYDIPSSYDWNSIELKKGHYNAISYSHQSFRLNQKLQNCQNYGFEYEYNSHSECIHDCKMRKSISECGVVFHGIDVRSDEAPVRFAKTESEKSCVANKDLDSYCAYECPNTDCVKDHYKSEMIINNANGWDYTYIRIIPPKEPQVTHHQSPFFQPKEIMYLWVTTIAIWLAALFGVIHLWLQTDTIPVIIMEKLNTINDRISSKVNGNAAKQTEKD